jgi:hypothetical protein
MFVAMISCNDELFILIDSELSTVTHLTILIV